MLILDGFSRYKLNEKYLKYKPVKQLKDDKRGWWQYAYRSVLEEDVKRRLYMWSWKRMKKHRLVREGEKGGGERGKGRRERRGRSSYIVYTVTGIRVDCIQRSITIKYQVKLAPPR